MTVRDSGLVASGRRGVAATARLSAARRWFLAAFAIGIGLTSPGQAAAQPARQAIAGTDVAMTVFDPGVNGSMGIIAWIDNSRLAFMVAPPNPEGKPSPKPLGLAFWRIGEAPIFNRPELTSMIAGPVGTTLAQHHPYLCITPDRIAYLVREAEQRAASFRLMIGPHHGEEAVDPATLSRRQNLPARDAVNPFTCRIVRIPDIPAANSLIVPLKQADKFLIFPDHINGPIQLHDAATGSTRTLLVIAVNRPDYLAMDMRYFLQHNEYLNSYTYIAMRAGRHPEMRMYRWRYGWTLGLDGRVEVLDIPDDDDTFQLHLTRVGDYIGRYSNDPSKSERTGGYLRRNGREIKIIDGGVKSGSCWINGLGMR